MLFAEPHEVRRAPPAALRKLGLAARPLEPSEATALVAKAAEGKASSGEIAINLITCGLGTGIFTLPWSTAGASALPAVVIAGTVLALNAWTISIIVEAGERHQTFNIGALMGRLPGALGRVAENGINSFTCVSAYLCLVGYIIVIADCLGAMLPLSQGVAFPRRALVALSALAVLPLCFLDQSRLSFTSTLAVAATLSIFANICTQFVHEEVTHSRPPACYFGLSVGSVAMVSAMMQVIVIQMCVLPMYAELKDRTPAKFNRIVALSFLALFVLCSLFAVVGYLAFGADVSSNVLLNLPDTRWGHLSRAGGALGCAAVYPIVMLPMLAPLRSSALACKLGSGVVAGATLCIVAASAAAALYVTDLGFVNVVNGALSCGVFVAMTPSLVGLYLLGERSAVWNATMYALVIVGTTFAVLGLLLKDNYAGALHNACMLLHQAVGH